MNNDSGKLIVFVLISGIILFGYNYFFMPKQTAGQAQPAKQAATAGTAKPAAGQAVQPAGTAQPAVQAAGAMVPSEITTASEKTYTLENSLFTATFSSIGGTLKSLKLKKFTDSKASPNVMELLASVFKKGGKNQGQDVSLVELVPSPSSYTYLSLSSPEYGVGQAGWQASGVTKDSITFSRQLKPGITAVKVFTASEDSYVIDTKIKIVNKSGAPYAVKDLQYTWGPNIHFLPEDLIKSGGGVKGGYNKVAYSSLKSFKTMDMNLKTKDTVIKNLDVVPDWVVLKDLYFASSFIINKKDDVKSVAIKQTAGGFAYMTLNLRDMLVNPGSEEVIDIPSYIGAAEYKRLKKVNMEQSVDLGSIRFLGVWMFYALDFAYKVTKNWGLAILLITVLIRVALWYPSNNSYKHMKDTQQKMNIIKPRLDTLKKIYKDDPQKQNEEMMKLYQEYKINPFGGCLPLLLQIPIFIALYATLINMVELKGASFALWWTDLSRPDPLYVLPVFMGVTMLIQQKMSQTAPSMSQDAEMSQKMLLYGMPIMLTVMSFSWPAGLMLYWGISNVLGIIQQMIVNKTK